LDIYLSTPQRLGFRPVAWWLANTNADCCARIADTPDNAQPGN
jgi:hypothetical protein